MTYRLRHKIIANHLWRSLRALLLLLAVLIWLLQDGFTYSDVIILGLCLTAHLVEQLHGYICNRIEKLLGWNMDFKDWE